MSNASYTRNKTTLNRNSIHNTTTKKPRNGRNSFVSCMIFVDFAPNERKTQIYFEKVLRIEIR